MKLFAFFFSATLAALLLKLFSVLLVLQPYPLPESVQSTKNYLTLFLFLASYFSLFFIFLHFREKAWYPGSMIAFLGLTVAVFVGSRAGLPQDLLRNFSIVLGLLLVAIVIGFFFVRAREVSGQFKWLAVLMITITLLKAIIPAVIHDFVSVGGIQDMKWLLVISELDVFVYAMLLFINYNMMRITGPGASDTPALDFEFSQLQTFRRFE